MSGGVSISERNPVACGLALGMAIAAFAATLAGLCGIGSVEWATLAVCLFGFGRPASFQGALAFPLCIATATIAATSPHLFAVPVAVGILAANLLTRTESDTRFGIEHLAFAAVLLLAHALTQAFLAGVVFAAWHAIVTLGWLLGGFVLVAFWRLRVIFASSDDSFTRGLA